MDLEAAGRRKEAPGGGPGGGGDSHPLPPRPPPGLSGPVLAYSAGGRPLHHAPSGPSTSSPLSLGSPPPPVVQLLQRL